ncbi:glutathione S-transferase C-terminal-like protein [Pisolithus orientalis]|uniref:glutathione S-transferase C-terminal-like protein n=1 Tax=Pisolithus orientalis TaxID=936130 RepID=UPI0022250B7C|nr:glutathione S-transferase C-terminal-like protein [Pisolithus orientalis]KAI5998941.1 glutathione S-transferase C-terminal-like protein [Pisolithus orientalis]
MATIGKLYGHPRQPQTRALTISGLEIDLPPFELGVTNKLPEITHKFPLAKIPAFEDNEGFKLIERRDHRSLRGIHFAETEIRIPGTNIYIGMVSKYLPGFGEEERKYYQGFIGRSLKFLEDYLTSRPSGLLTVCGTKERKDVYPHVFAHFAKVANDERIKHFFRDLKFVDEPLAFKVA